MVNDTQYAADRCASRLPPKGKRPKPPASTRPRCCAGNGGPHGARSLEDRVVWIPARPSDPADLEAWCRRKSGLLPAAPSVVSRKSVKKKNAHGFFLARWGEVLGSRKKLQGKDLQKQKRCGLLECSCEDVRNSLAGGKQ